MKVLLLVAVCISLTYAQNSDTVCASKPNGELIAVPNEPDKFYHCDNCIGVLKCCPSGLIFSAVDQACIWPDSGCGSGSCVTTPPTITASTVPTNPTVTAPPPVTTPSTPIPTVTTPSTPRPTVTTPSTPKPTVTVPPSPPPITEPPTTDCPVLCPNGVYRPFPGDLSKYIVCSGGIDTTMCCPSGLVWNNDLVTCERKNSACGGACP